MMDKNDLLKQRKIVDMFKSKACVELGESTDSRAANQNNGIETEERVSEETLVDEVSVESFFKAIF